MSKRVAMPATEPLPCAQIRPRPVNSKPVWHTSAWRACAVVTAFATVSCSTLSDVTNSVIGQAASPAGTPGFVTGFLGGVVADEPRAALVGREILSSGGNAADAAVAVGFALAVTLPSRAGFGGGGACLAYAPGKRSVNAGVPEAVLFVPPAPAVAAGERPAAVPMLPRGLFALHARYGRTPFETLISPAEQMARFGFQASRAFVRDLGAVAGPLSGDPESRAVFFPNGVVATEGATIVQPDLAATISQLRTSGVGDFYQGGGARRIAGASARAGGPISTDDLRGAVPKLAPGLSLRVAGGSTAIFLPPPADGGLAAAAAFRVLSAGAGDYDAASARALATAAAWRRGGVDADALLAADPPPATVPPLPASTSFATLDRDGNAVVCALTMNNLFGTGRIAPGTGVVLAASPNWMPPPLLSAAIAYNGNLNAFRAAVGGTGQAAAPAATAFALVQALADRAVTARALATPPPDPGRANVIECNQYLPGENGSCAWATDPRGAGLAVGSN